ncbi:hypothetical protein FNAPI_6792 [Fusarium napiforme]|uniref:Uncharacterized protein n=1 Tax=Fusarium napiforme TaxID=42672 RepID=A0A8H5JE24_9HYPO|nr:hypothetical protein FNAPI_6792 [Fusarium napiforme]
MEPTALGFIRNAVDALLVLEACLQGRFLYMSRPLRAEEAQSAVQDGAIFVYEVDSSGIHEWSDHRQWHDEFVLGDFRVSCEADLDSAHLAGRLIRQSITLYWNGMEHHVISYFQMLTLRRVVTRGTGPPQSLGQLQIRDGLVEMQLHLRYSVAYSPCLFLAPFFVRKIYPFEPPAPASFENLLAFDKGELGLVHHVESSGWTECSLLKCGTVGWMPLNYCNVFEPKPLRPLLQAVIKLSEALRLHPDVPIDGRDIDAIVHGVSSIMNLGYRLDVDCPQIGAWKILHPTSICVHNLVLVLQKQVGTMLEGTPIQGKKDSTHRAGIVSIAFKIVIKADTFLSTVKKLHKSRPCRDSTDTETPSTVDDESQTSSTTTAVDASDSGPDSPLAKGPDKHEHVAYIAPTSPQRSPERQSSPEAQERQDHHTDLQDSDSKAQLEQQPLHRSDDILLQPLGHRTSIQDLSS